MIAWLANFGLNRSRIGRIHVANYVAVAEAVRLAGKQTTLLREVMKTRSQGGTSVSKSSLSGPSKKVEIKSIKK
jgi:hypothetical protein